MADLKTVIGLLYRADWTRLSLSATVRSERDGDLARRRLDAVRPAWFRPGPAGEDVAGEEQGGYHTGRAALLIAPGRRYRLGYLDDRAGDTEGSDGEHGWTRWRPGQAPPWSAAVLPRRRDRGRRDRAACSG